MNIETLRQHFIYLDKEFVEGEVFLFFQDVRIEKPIERARFLGTAFGMYDAYLNGRKIGDQFFKPGYSYYPKRLLCQEDDVKGLLNDGVNQLKVYLSQGWYAGRFFYQNTVQNYGPRPSLSYVLEIVYEDGETVTFASREGDTVWSSEYDYAGEYDGEILDFRKPVVPIGTAKRLPEPDVSLEPTRTRVKLQETMEIREVLVRKEGVILDFGQNFAGVIAIDPNLLASGETVRIRHGEILNPDGSLYTRNLRQAKATLSYTRNVETDLYVPRFTYMGFRYAEITGVPYRPGLVRAHALYTEMARIGHFRSSHPQVDQLYRNLVWGQKSNYVEIPTDCPQRDERLGYTGDGHVFARTGSLNFDTLAFWENFFRDLVLGQADNPDGNVPAYLPQVGPTPVGFLSMQGWGSAVSIIPEILYEQYGAKDFFLNQFEAIRKYVDLEIRKAGRRNLWNAVSLGDWLSLGKGMAWQAMHNHPISNAFFVNDLRILCDLAKMRGNQADHEKYRLQYEKIKKAYVSAFLTKDGRMKTDDQGAYVLALRHVLGQDDPIRERVVRCFIDNVRKNGIATGFFGTEYLLPLLADCGEPKLAYDLLLGKDCPGWMYQIERGATTTWERWDAIRPDGTVNETKAKSDNMVSFNHYAFGSVGEFYYQYILGIKPLLPGYQEILLRPFVDARVGSAEGSYDSVVGRIESAWAFEGDSVRFRFKVPAKAVICLPDGTEERVEAGEHHYIIDRKKIERGEDRG